MAIFCVINNSYDKVSNTMLSTFWVLVELAIMDEYDSVALLLLSLILSWFWWKKMTYGDNTSDVSVDWEERKFILLAVFC